MKEGARIYCADEIGIQSTDNRGKHMGSKAKPRGSRKVNLDLNVICLQ